VLAKKCQQLAHLVDFGVEQLLLCGCHQVRYVFVNKIMIIAIYQTTRTIHKWKTKRRNTGKIDRYKDTCT
jgi:hypothetical protein